MKKQDKNSYKGLAIMWFIFGCVFIVYTLLSSGDILGKSLTSLASILFFITSWINWRNFKKL